MPEPISCSPSSPTNPNLDPYSDDVGKMSRADAPNSSQAQPQPASSPPETPATSSPAVPKLVSSVSPPLSVLPPAASTANNNAQRTSERLGLAPFAAAGATGSGDAVFAGVAVIKGHDKAGVDIEVLSASAQIGKQTEAQLGFQRISGSRGALSGSVETFTARANVGIYNDDGSKGLNFGVGATAVGLEGTFGTATSVTYGVAGGVGVAGSIGVRDIDHDGKTELCARASWGPVTAGICVENPL